MSERERLHLVVHGDVQGIGYRWFVQKSAQRLRLRGWVRNLNDGSVEVAAEGRQEMLDKFIDSLRHDHPLARIDRMEVQKAPAAQEKAYREFLIQP